MKRIVCFVFFVTIFFTVRVVGNDHYQVVPIESEFGDITEALLFPALSDSLAILVHQYGGSKETWIGFAERLQKNNITALAIGNNGRRDVLDAVKYVQNTSNKKITLIGASMGGGSVLQAAQDNPQQFHNIILLSPIYSVVTGDQQLPKLFFVAKQDGWGAKAYDAYRDSDPPKKLMEYEGFAHGQALLSGEYAQEINQIIIDFILK